MLIILGLGGGRYFCVKYFVNSIVSIDVFVKKREKFGWLND